jgi:hypothetical protein
LSCPRGTALGNHNAAGLSLAGVFGNERLLREPNERYAAEATRLARVLAEEQAPLRRVATLVARGVPPAEVFPAVAQEVRHVLGADATTIVRLDPDGAATILTRVGDPAEEIPAGSRWNLEPPLALAVALRTGRPARR